MIDDLNLAIPYSQSIKKNEKHKCTNVIISSLVVKGKVRYVLEELVVRFKSIGLTLVYVFLSLTCIFKTNSEFVAKKKKTNIFLSPKCVRDLM